MSETEWRSIGVQQSRVRGPSPRPKHAGAHHFVQGWQHYMVHRPEPHILLFRRGLAAQ